MSLSRLAVAPASSHHLAEQAPTETSGPVCIDVGGDRGALILWSTVDRAGIEVEIQPLGEPQDRTHVYVLPRSTGQTEAFAALFPSLREGRYEVLDETGRAVEVVEISPGIVTSAHWG